MSEIPRRVLWADDDASERLESLGRLLVKRGKLNLLIAGDYQNAMKSLDQSSMDGPHGQVTALIVDTILPPGLRHAALGSYLGFKCAEYAAAKAGMRAIVFLSVVPYGEIVDQFALLRQRYPHVRFDYFDKLSIFEGANFNELINALG